MLVAIVAAGCAASPVDAPPPDPAAPTVEGPTGWAVRTTTQLGHLPGSFHAMGVGPLDHARNPGTGSEAPPGPPAPDEPSTAARLLPALTGGTYDRTYGTDLDAAIAALPEPRQVLGVAGVDASDLFGVGDAAGLCQDPHVLLSVDGAEASLAVPWGLWLAGPLERDLLPLPEDCVAALLAAGTVETAICDAEDVRAHFPEGSACRACVTVDGDMSRCIDEGECSETATRQIRSDGTWYGALRVPALLCAPDHVADVLLLVEELAEDDPLPETYDHGAVAGACIEAWDGAAVDLYCGIGEYHAIGDALPSRVDFIRDAEGAVTGTGRISLVRSVEIEGTSFTRTWLSETGGTGLSAPNGTGDDAWGINPRALRPDGVDPDEPDDTYARDYIAAFVLKMATTRNGVMVGAMNHNRCSDDSWEGPHADGSYSCDAPGAWTMGGWNDDALVAWWDQRAGEIYVFPIVTLASTGLPDPSVPGGLLPEVLGSTSLADDEWEACSWSKTFVPDRVRLLDPAPGTSDEPYASFDAQTYRLGRDPDEDIRLFLATSQQRGFCPP